MREKRIHKKEERTDYGQGDLLITNNCEEEKKVIRG